MRIKVDREMIDSLILERVSFLTYKYIIKTKGEYFGKVFISITETPRSGPYNHSGGTTLYHWENNPKKQVKNIKQLFK